MANEEAEMCQNIFLTSYLSTGKVLQTVGQHICHQNNMGTVVNMLLPVHRNACHWGLAILSIKDQTVFFDDGYHCPIPKELKTNCRRITDIIFQTSGDVKFNPSDQPSSESGSPEACGSCGVAVVCAIRDVCN